MTTAPCSAGSEATAFLRTLQVLSLLTVANLAWQFGTAGQLFPQGGPEELHSGGAIVLHVLSGLAAVAALLAWRAKGIGVGVFVLAVAVFAFTFIQAAMGGRQTLYVHVPGAMILTAGVVWQLVAALRVGRSSRG